MEKARCCLKPDSPAFKGFLAPFRGTLTAGVAYLPHEAPLAREVGDLALEQSWNTALKAQLGVPLQHPRPPGNKQCVPGDGISRRLGVPAFSVSLWDAWALSPSPLMV